MARCRCPLVEIRCRALFIEDPTGVASARHRWRLCGPAPASTHGALIGTAFGFLALLRPRNQRKGWSEELIPVIPAGSLPWSTGETTCPSARPSLSLTAPPRTHADS